MDKKLSANYSLEIGERGEAYISFKGKQIGFLGVEVNVTNVFEHTENAISFTYSERQKPERICLCITGYYITNLLRGAHVTLEVINGIEQYFANIRDGIYILYNPTVNMWWLLKEKPNMHKKDEIIKTAEFIKKYCEG